MPYGFSEGAYEAPPIPLDRVRAHAAAHPGGTPYLLHDPSVIARKVRGFRKALPGVALFYAMKANPDPSVLACMNDLGVQFEIASIYELDLLEQVGVSAEGAIFSNPVKPVQAISEAFRRGISTMAVDDLDEVKKIVGVSPAIRMCLRIEVANTGSDWPLTGKFGASTSEALEIIDYCAANGLPLIGLTFHVGSQCRASDNWHAGIETARLLFARMKQAGLTPDLLNLGGGFPIQHTRPIPAIHEIGETLRASLAGLPTEIAVMAEPGRYLVGDSCWMVTRVVGTATRKGRRWVYLDVGTFTGLAETLERFDYELLCDRHGPEVPTTVAGPTCDTADLLFDEKMLPEDLVAGDFVYIPNAGAYTTCYASRFNGFPLPEMHLLEGGRVGETQRAGAV